MAKRSGWGIFIGVLVLALGILAVSEGIKLGFKVTAEESGVGLFPVIIGGGLILCGLYQLFGASTVHLKPLSGSQRRTVAGIFLGLIAYSLAVVHLGYALATFLFVLVITRMLGNPSWLRSGAMALATVIFFLLVFKIWMQMPLPTGVIEQLLGVY